MNLNEQLFTQPNCLKLIIALGQSGAVLLELPDPDCSIHCASATLNGRGLRWDILLRTFSTLNSPYNYKLRRYFKNTNLNKWANQNNVNASVVCLVLVVVLLAFGLSSDTP